MAGLGTSDVISLNMVKFSIVEKSTKNEKKKKIKTLDLKCICQRLPV